MAGSGHGAEERPLRANSEAASKWLEDPEELTKSDSRGQLRILDRFDSQLENALAIGEDLEDLDLGGPFQNILCCGLGGSAIGGDFLASYLGEELAVPFQVHRGYGVPGCVDPRTLVLVCSYSGNTEETLSAFRAARSAGAQTVCVSSNGELGRLAGELRCPWVRIPPGLPPRSALGYLTVPVLLLLHRLGLVPDRSPEVRRSIAGVRRTIAAYRADHPIDRNPAKQLALQIHGCVTVVYGSRGRLDSVARRWAGQFCENAKQLTHFATLPESDHNQIAGWKHPDAALKRMAAVFLRDRGDHSRLQIRHQVTRRLISRLGTRTLEVWSEGEGWLERLWSLILLGDYGSIYLALLNREDPTPIKVIEDLKEHLAGISHEGL